MLWTPASSWKTPTTTVLPYNILTYFCLFPERARLVNPWPLKMSHLNTASFHYMRKGAGLSCFLPSTIFLLLHEVSSYQVPAELGLAHDQLSSTQTRTAELAQQSTPCGAVRCNALPCGVLQWRAMPCPALPCFAVP